MKIAVLVTTAHRGVFFGYVEEDTIMAESLILEKARNCLLWTADVKGFLGLATTGPSQTCRIGPAPARVLIRNVTSVAECTPAAVKAWEAAPWAT